MSLTIESKLAVCFIQNFDATLLKPYAIHMQKLKKIKSTQSKIYSFQSPPDRFD